jgi:hypothetical protein
MSSFTEYAQRALGCGKFTPLKLADLPNNPQHQVSIKVSVSSGRYLWCGNNYHGERSGYYMSTSGGVDNGGVDNHKHMIRIMVSMNRQLADAIDMIEIYRTDGFLAQYSLGLSHRSTYEFFFSLEENSGELLMKFREFHPEVPHGSLSRMPMRTIHTELLTVPEFKIMSSDTCAICLEPVLGDAHVTECRHIFHTPCIWEYLTHNGQVRPSACDGFCHHGDKVVSFNCPVCRTKQHGGVSNS